MRLAIVPITVLALVSSTALAGTIRGYVIDEAGNRVAGSSSSGLAHGFARSTATPAPNKVGRKRLPMPMEISLSQSMLLRSTCSLPVLIISLGWQRHLSVPPCVSFSVASDYDRSSNQSLQHSHSPRESPIPVRQTPLAFHRRAQRNADRRRDMRRNPDRSPARIHRCDTPRTQRFCRARFRHWPDHYLLHEVR